MAYSRFGLLKNFFLTMKYATRNSIAHTAIYEKYFVYFSAWIHRYEYSRMSGNSPHNPAARTL